MGGVFLALRSALVALLACAMTALPSCASMGGGGMRYSIADPPSAAQDVST
jgi:hypothetical protein